MKIINKIVFILLIVALGFLVWMYLNPKIKEVYVNIKPKPEIVYVPTEAGNKMATVQIIQSSQPEEVFSKNYLSYVNDTLVQALNKGLKYQAEVQRLTNVNAIIRDSLTKKNIVVHNVKKDAQNAKNEAITYKTKYIEITSNLRDSSLVYSYNAQLDIIDYVKKEKLFGEKKQFIAVSSPDKNFKINDVTNFTKEIKPPKDFVELNLKVQGLYINKSLVPYGGAELLFNPDGRIKPIVGYNYFYDHSTGKFTPYYLAGFQLNLFRF